MIGLPHPHEVSVVLGHIWAHTRTAGAQPSAHLSLAILTLEALVEMGCRKIKAGRICWTDIPAALRAGYHGDMHWHKADFARTRN